MAKLEDQISAMELLSLVKSGAVKSDLLKKFRASEQEFAVILLPLYRSGDMTKEEFNDFFNEVPLRNKPQAVSQPQDDPPTEALNSLSQLFGQKNEESKAPEPHTIRNPELEAEIKPELEVSALASPAEESVDEPPSSGSVQLDLQPQDSEQNDVIPDLPPNTIEASLESIFNKLNLIEKRLIRLEKKLIGKA